MARLFVDRQSINEGARHNLVSLLQTTTGRITKLNMFDLIKMAGFLPDYKDYGSDMACIRLAIREVPIKQQEKFIKMFTPPLERISPWHPHAQSR